MSVIKKFVDSVKYGFELSKVRNLMREKEYEQSMVILESIKNNQRMSKYNFVSYYVEGLFYTDKKNLAEVHYKNLIDILTKKFEKGELRKQELFWIIEYYYLKFGYEYEGISDYLEPTDGEPRNRVRPHIKHRYDQSSIPE